MLKADLNNNICVLIMSCDKYADLWNPFFYFFDKYWSDCPYPIYLATNTKTYHHKNVQVIHSNHKGTWSEETSTIFNKLPYETIIYLQDDYFILNKVDNNALQNLCEKFKFYNADYLRLFPIIGPDKLFEEESGIGLISSEAKYRTSLQAAIWKKKTFMKLLISSENQWDFEVNSPQRSIEYLFLSIKKQERGKFKNHIYPINYYYLTAVLRGKWRRGILKICKKENVILDFNIRKPESLIEYYYQHIYEISPIFIKKCLDYTKSKITKVNMN